MQPLLDPQPLIVVQDGEVIEANLRKERMTVDELLAEARQQQIALARRGEVGGARVERQVSFIPNELIVPLYLTEAEVAELLTPRDALDAVEGCFERLARGSVAEPAAHADRRSRTGSSRYMAAADAELGFAGTKTYAWLPGGTPFVVVLFDLERAELAAVIEADKLGQLRTGAASGVAAKHLAKPDPRTLGVIGCGWQAETQVACIREACPTIERVVAYCRIRGAARGVLRSASAPSRARRTATRASRTSSSP